MDTITIDEYSERVAIIAFRVFKKDYPTGPRTEPLRVLIIGRNQRKRAKSWMGVLIDEPRYARVKVGAQVLVSQKEAKKARPMTYGDLGDMLKLYRRHVVIQGKGWLTRGGLA